MFLYLSTSGWKNAQLAQQLEERERRIKGHLDMAAKGEGLLSIALFQKPSELPMLSSACTTAQNTKKYNN